MYDNMLIWLCLQLLITCTANRHNEGAFLVAKGWTRLSEHTQQTQLEFHHKSISLQLLPRKGPTFHSYVHERTCFSFIVKQEADRVCPAYPSLRQYSPNLWRKAAVTSTRDLVAGEQLPLTGKKPLTSHCNSNFTKVHIQVLRVFKKEEGRIQ